MKIPTEQLKKMIEMVMKTKEIELSCDDVHDILDQYAELTLAGEDVSELLPLVHHHLEMCPDCREEFEALTRILKSQDD
jgi:predicted anti-sigma-YlaC factor YlaD